VGDYLQTAEEQRVQSFKDEILNIMVGEISALRNLQYDLDRIAKRVDYIDPHQDILQFIKNNNT
jgi:hypothetical protein